MHQPHLGGGLEARPEALQRARHQRGGEEAPRFIGTARGGVVRQRTGQRHRQGAVLVHESRDEGTAQHEGRQVDMRVALDPCALLDQRHVEPRGLRFHRRDEGAQFGRRVGHRLDPLVAGPVEHVDQAAEPEFGHQRGIGVGGAVAHHRIAADGGDAVFVGQQFGAATGHPGRQFDRVGGIHRIALGQPREIDCAVNLRDRALLRHHFRRIERRPGQRVGRNILCKRGHGRLLRPPNLYRSI